MKAKLPLPRLLALTSALLILAATPVVVQAQEKSSSTAPGAAATAGAMPDIRIVLHTDKGDVEAKLFPSKAPVTVASFLNLAKRGFYNGLTFHRIIPAFMAQGGDPTGTGAGSPGYRFEDEFRPELRFDKAGLFAMANSGPATNGSQFFITHVPTPHLNDKHTIFGQVTKGQGETVMSLKPGDKIKGIDVLDPTDALFAAQSAKLTEWNAALDKNKR